jgi:hypothetical protein
VVLGHGVVFLMDGNDRVNDFWSDSFLVNDWLDGLVNVMVYVLALDSRSCCCGMSGLVGMGGVLELGSLTFKYLTSLVVVAVVKFLVDGIFHDVVVLFREDLLMLDGLDCGVIVVLVDFLVDSFLHLLMAVGPDVLAGNGGDDGLGHIGSVAPLAREASNCCFSFLHVDVKTMIRSSDDEARSRCKRSG